MPQFCAFDDHPVMPLRKGDKEWGKTEDPPGILYRHEHSSEGGVPGCGRRFLTEDQIYTVGDSDLTPPTEPQY